MLIIDWHAISRHRIAHPHPSLSLAIENQRIDVAYVERRIYSEGSQPEASMRRNANEKGRAIQSFVTGPKHASTRIGLRARLSIIV